MEMNLMEFEKKDEIKLGNILKNYLPKLSNKK
jgi:hypothetical protein